MSVRPLLALFAAAAAGCALTPADEETAPVGLRQPRLAGQVIGDRYFARDAGWSVQLPPPEHLARGGERAPWTPPLVLEVPTEAPIQAVRFTPDGSAAPEATFEVAWLPRGDGRATDLASFERVAVRSFEVGIAAQLELTPQLLARVPIDSEERPASRWIYLVQRPAGSDAEPPARLLLMVRDLVELDDGFFACLALVDVLALAEAERRDPVAEVLPLALARVGPVLTAVGASIQVH